MVTLRVPGRLHPVTTFYMPETPESYLDAACVTVCQVALDRGMTPGDILVFLPGQEEIEDLRGLLSTQGREFMAVEGGGGGGVGWEGGEGVGVLGGAAPASSAPKSGGTLPPAATPPPNPPHT